MWIYEEIEEYRGLVPGAGKVGAMAERRNLRKYEPRHVDALGAAIARAKKPEPPKPALLSGTKLIEAVGDQLAATVKRERLTLDQAVAVVKSVKLGAERASDGKGGTVEREVRVELSDRELRRVLRDVLAARNVEFAS